MKTAIGNTRIDARLTFAALIALTLTLGTAARPEAIGWWDAICGNGLFASGGASHAAPRPATTLTVLSCEALPNVPGKSVTTAIVEFPPMAFTPAHRHPGSVTAVVLDGTIRSQLEGAPPANYTRGQTWFEPPGALHVFAENHDPARPARLLATFVADTHCGPLTIPER